MADVVQITREGAIGLIGLNNPPVNAAGHGLRAGLAAAVDALEGDDSVQVIAIYGEGRSFIAGADIREFGKPAQAPLLPDVCNRLERCTKPVISVLHGAALGGGLEVAIATHARIAIDGVQLGFPEVGLGILPGAGGTQRGPRLVGIANALDLITSGKRITATQALAIGLVDKVVTGDARHMAIAAARDVLAGRLATRVTGDEPVAPDDAAIAASAAMLQETQAHLFSPHHAVRAVAASLRPLTQGLIEERRLFNECMDSPQRAGLIHAFFAERAVAKIPESGATPRHINKIGVIGAGTMGAGIATSCLLAGCQVVLVDRTDDAVARGRATVAANLDGAVKRGKMSADARAGILLTTAVDMAAIAGSDLVIEAAFEDMAVKKALMRQIADICPDALLATNTSYLNLDDIAAATARPQDVIGLHFFSPAHVMRLLEVVVGAKTRPDAVATGFALAKRLGKVAVRSGVCDGFIGNRIMNHYRKAADHMMLDGATPDQIDTAVRGFGFAMGPFEVSDLAGLDIGWANRKRVGRVPGERYVSVADKLCEAGQFGRKTGRGFYDHENGGANPDLMDLLAHERAAHGVTPRAFTADEIVARYMTAMIAEATRVVQDGIALRPIDVDAVFLFGYGFPRWRGGPLHYADTLGAAEILRRINGFAKDDAQFWQVPPLLRDMAETGRTFADMNREG